MEVPTSEGNVQDKKPRKPRKQYSPYTCIRCGYTTQDRAKIRRHLYDMKRPCPTDVNDIELTDAIKEHIVDFRIYHMPKVEQQTVIQHYHNQINQQFNNIICGMDAVDKINTLAKHKNVNLLDLQDHINNRFSTNIDNLESGGDHNLGMHDLLLIVDKVSDPAALEELNLMYDEKVNKLALFDCGKWDKFIYQHGVIQLITTIQESYLNYYEKHLISKMENKGISHQERAKYEELLIVFYQFLAAFNAKPISVLADNDKGLIFDRSSSSYDLKDRYSAKYRKIKDAMKQSEIAKIGRDVLDILKRNSKRNMDDINRKMMALLKVDEEFKTAVMQLSGV